MRDPSSLLRMDLKISSYFEKHQKGRRSTLFRACSHLGAGALWISIYVLCFIFCPVSAHSLLWKLILAELTGLSVIIPLRYLTKRNRPSPKYKCFFLTPWNRYSFPSHHAFRAFVIALIAGAGHPKTLTAFLLAAVLVGFSRIYLLKHYLSDVLAGALLAFIVACAFKGS